MRTPTVFFVNFNRNELEQWDRFIIFALSRHMVLISKTTYLGHFVTLSWHQIWVLGFRVQQMCFYMSQRGKCHRFPSPILYLSYFKKRTFFRVKAILTKTYLCLLTCELKTSAVDLRLAWAKGKMTEIILNVLFRASERHFPRLSRTRFSSWAWWSFCPPPSTHTPLWWCGSDRPPGRGLTKPS